MKSQQIPSAAQTDDGDVALRADLEAVLVKHETLKTEWQEEAALLIAEKFALKGENASLRKKLKDLTSKEPS